MTDDYWSKQSPERVYEALLGSFRELMLIEETLAGALGYPRSEGGATDPNGGGYIIGDHTPGSLALEAKERLAEKGAPTMTPVMKALVGHILVLEHELLKLVAPEPS